MKIRLNIWDKIVTMKTQFFGFTWIPVMSPEKRKSLDMNWVNCYNFFQQKRKIVRNDDVREFLTDRSSWRSTEVPCESFAIQISSPFCSGSVSNLLYCIRGSFSRHSFDVRKDLWSSDLERLALILFSSTKFVWTDSTSRSSEIEGLRICADVIDSVRLLRSCFFNRFFMSLSSADNREISALQTTLIYQFTLWFSLFHIV